MEVAALIELIPTLGFPIIVCIALGFFVYKLWQQSAEREDKLFQELSESRAINGKFAEIIAEYEVKLDEIKSDVKEIKNDITEIKVIQG